MKKPDPDTIRTAPKLSSRAAEMADPLAACNLCGVTVDPTDLSLEVWREHDERDRPIAGIAALVFVGKGRDHEACRKTLDEHPRLYAEEAGDPGHFPMLCVGCRHRDRLVCRSPLLRANGGTGLPVKQERLAAIVCSRGAGGCHRPIAHAVECEGFEKR